MLISKLNILKFNNTQAPEKTNSRQELQSAKIQMKQPLQRDTVSFGAKIPSLMTPTIEDIIKGIKPSNILTRNILRLAEHDIPCPVCNCIMFPKSKCHQFEENILNATTSKEMLDFIAEHKKYLHPVEKKIFSMMREDLSQYPEMTLLEMIKRRLPASEKRIIFIQSKIFNKIEELSRKLPEEHRRKVSDLINETYERILDPIDRSRFSRQTFLDKLKSIFISEEMRQEYKGKLPDWIYSKQQSLIIAEAVKLPAATDNIDAFIVKYSKRNYKGANPNQQIALRLLSESEVSIEHIKAQSQNGSHEAKNLALECRRCNNGRNDESIIEQITENPQMINNYPNYIKRLCELHKEGIVEKSYIRSQNQTYFEESCGMLSADLSSIEGQTIFRNTKKIKSDKTPTKEERRAARKEKIKAQKQKNKNNIYKK